MHSRHEVVVIGGGPGGSTAATALAQKGLRVLLLERDHFPRHHIGESLLPASMPFLEWLDVMPRVEQAGFLPKWGATMVWGREREPWSWQFRETNERYPHTYQVVRSQFDKILLDNSRELGVDVREGHRVTRVLFDGQRARGVAFRADDGVEEMLPCDFVLDASGQMALLGRRLGLRRWDDFFRNMAVYAYFTGASRLAPPDENNLLVESYDGGWCWSIPLHTGQMSVGVVIDSGYGQRQLASRQPVELLRRELERAPYTSRLLAGAELASEAHVVKDWSYMSGEVVGEGYILAGDAACFVDPLFSSGVHLAMMSGAMAAAYVVTALKDPAMAGPAARFYKENYLQEYEAFRSLARLFYSTNRSVESYFWETRRLFETGGPDDLSPRQAFLRAVGGRPPRGYERVVVEAGVLPEDLASQLSASEGEAETRRRRAAHLSGPGQLEALLASRVSLAPGFRLQKQPEISDGEFRWGYAIGEADVRIGRPCDDLTAALLSRLDGKRTASEALLNIGAQGDAIATQRLRLAATAALKQLYLEGLITGAG